MTHTPQSKLQSQFDPKQFHRYPKIKNIEEAFDPDFYDSEDDFNNFVNKATPNTFFYVSEKIDGANIGVWVPRRGLPSFFSRNGEDPEKLYRFSEDKEQLVEFVTGVQKLLSEDDVDIAGFYFWGEYYGSYINKRIKYRDDSHFRFYDAIVVGTDGSENAIGMGVNIILNSVDNLEGYRGFYERFCTPSYVSNASFAQVRKICALPSKSELADDDNKEGNVYVVMRFDPAYQYGMKIIGRYKDKDERFSDKKAKPNAKTVIEPWKKYNELFGSYINKNRALDTRSKTSVTNLQKLSMMLIQDAIYDFDRDYEDELKQFDNLELKKIHNAGSKPFLLMKNLLEKGDKCAEKSD